MAVISDIPASESAFENGNRTFLISEIINFPDKKKQKKSLIFATIEVSSGVLSIYRKSKDTNAPHTQK